MIDGFAISEPNWSRLEKFPPARITCRCGAVWWGYAQSVSTDTVFTLLAQKTCSVCGRRTNLRSISHPPEKMTLE